MGEALSMKRFLLVRYAVAVVAVALTVLLKVLLEHLVAQETPFLLLLGGVVVSAWFGGLGPGLLATAIAALAADYFFLAPIGSFTGQGLKVVPLGLFALQGVLVSLLVEALHSARQRAEASALEAQSHQESLRESEELYRTVVEQAAENIFIIDAESKRILEANAALSRSLGYTPQELKRLTLYDVVAYDREDIDRNIRHILEGHGFTGERRYRRKDGSLIDVEVNASLISHRGKQAMCVVAHDVTERKSAETQLRHSLDSLLALYEAAQILGSTLKREQIGSRLLEITQRISNLSAACIVLQDDDQQLHTLRATGSEALWCRVRSAPEAEGARRAVLETGEPRSFELQPLEATETRLAGLCLPLWVRDRAIGLLEAYGSEALTQKENLNILVSVAKQGASALENARLYEELAERERELQDLVGRLLVAEEEERRRVAYDVHDGLTQMVVAVYQRLQIFAEGYPPDAAEGREELEELVELLRRTVAESRRVIADLRPTALDDFGLATAIRLQVEEMRAGGYEASYEEMLGEGRLPPALETALFRVLQEALTNVRKHAETDRVRVALGRWNGAVRLEVRDWGRGFEPTKVASESGPGERVGLSSMKERITLLGGDLEIHSESGKGTSVVAKIPLPVMEDGHGG